VPSTLTVVPVHASDQTVVVHRNAVTGIETNLPKDNLSVKVYSLLNFCLNHLARLLNANKKFALLNQVKQVYVVHQVNVVAQVFQAQPVMKVTKVKMVSQVAQAVQVSADQKVLSDVQVLMVFQDLTV